MILHQQPTVSVVVFVVKVVIRKTDFEKGLGIGLALLLLTSVVRLVRGTKLGLFMALAKILTAKYFIIFIHCAYLLVLAS